MTMTGTITAQMVMRKTWHYEQDEPDGDRDAGQDRRPGDSPNIGSGRGDGLTERQVSAAVSHVLHRLDQCRLQQERLEELDDGAKQRYEDPPGQREKPGHDSGDQVDDKGDDQKMRGMCLVQLPRLAEHTGKRVHGGDLSAGYWAKEDALSACISSSALLLG